MSQYCSPHFEITICDSILRRDFELILQLMSPFDDLEPSLDTLRVASIRVFRGTAPLGAYHRDLPHRSLPSYPTLFPLRAAKGTRSRLAPSPQSPASSPRPSAVRSGLVGGLGASFWSPPRRGLKVPNPPSTRLNIARSIDQLFLPPLPLRLSRTS